MQNLPMPRQQTMSSREIADLTGKDHKNVNRDVEHMLKELGIDTLKTERIYLDSMNRQQTEHHLDRELTETLLTGYSIPLRRKGIARWHELEAQSAAPAQVFNIPATLPEALRLAADLAEQKAIAEQERDEAIRTKAMIGSKREATAMATAAAAKREAERLAAELDQSMQYASVKRMEQIYTGRKFNWRELKKASVALGLKAIDVFDQNYITVKAYHAAAWKAVYSLDVMKDSAHA